MLDVQATPTPESPHEPSASPWVLATDLDGTFLGGSDVDRAHLAELLRFSGATLIFVTGRGLESVRPLLMDPGIPTPRFVICDVGATVWDVEQVAPVQPLQAEIEARWPGQRKVMATLEPFGELVRQDVPQERRCSFYADSEHLSKPLMAAARSLGCDVLFSAGRYLDILPAGVTKGSTLLSLLAHIGVPEDRVMVAGDTLNDLSLFQTGLKGVAVGGSEARLVEAVEGLPHTHLADRRGAGGILEGLLHHQMVREEHIELATPVVEAHPDAAQLVMVYHRLPFEEVRRGNKTIRRQPKSPNGIIPSLLEFFADGRSGSWIAWSQQESRDPEGFEPVVEVDPERFPNLKAARVPLTKDDVHLFYKKFSKEAFWPIIFSFPGRAKFDHDHWAHYVEVNRRFAEAAAEQAQQGATVWVHDYNLWLVPGFLRSLRPDLRIAFFHHTSFPPSDVFNIIPWRGEIVGSLLSCDYVGFHIPRYVENFVDVVRSNVPAKVVNKAACAPRYVTYGCALGVERVTTSLRTSERTVHLGVHPVGINVDRIEEIISRPDSQKRIEEIKQELAGKTCLLSVERLDYVKGPLQKIEAFEALLEQNPDLHGKVTMINVVTPPAPGMEIYQNVGDKVNQAIGRLNGRFGRIDWTPVRYFLRALPFEDVVCHYAAADIAWITPLRDGLNLVAKEFVAAQAASGGAGVLLLSEFAGAAVELQGAVLTNPFDGRNMVQALERALAMSEVEKKQRLDRLSNIVHAQDVRAWGEGFLRGVEAVER